MAVAARTDGRQPGRETPAAALRVGAGGTQDQDAARSLQAHAFGAAAVKEPPRPGDHHELRVAAQDGMLVSCLTLVRTHLMLRGIAVPMGGLRQVATHPERQNQGFASALIRNTLQAMRDDGALVSVLFPFSFRYYRKFGYELGGNHCHYWSRPNCIPAFAERGHCRPAMEADIPALAQLFEARSGRQGCGMARRPDRWRQLLSQRQVVVYAAPECSGFAVTAEERDSYGGRVLRVLDAHASHAGAWRGLLGHLARSGVESVEWDASSGDLNASGLLRSTAPLREGFKPRGIATVRPVFQLRVANLPALIRTLAPALPAGSHRLALRARDDVIPENARPLALQATSSGCQARPPRLSDPYLEADIRVITQILAGYMDAAEAVSQGLARCSSTAALEAAEHFFPAGDPYISEIDRF